MKILIYDSGKGMLSLIKEIIKQEKNNDYYLYVDKDLFPLGEKKKEVLKEHLSNLLASFLLDYDMVIIACNTMSLVYNHYFSKDNRVILISDYNFKEVKKDDTILATPLAIKLIEKDCHKLASNLAKYIENNNIVKIIKVVKKMRFKSKRIILGCTHYPLIKEIFSNYHKDKIFVSFEADLVSSLSSEQNMSFNSNIKLEEFYINRQ